MVKIYVVNENNLFLEEIEVEKVEEGMITTPLPVNDLYHPKWNGKEWIEGLSDEGIAELETDRTLSDEQVQTVEELSQEVAELKEALRILLGSGA